MLTDVEAQIQERWSTLTLPCSRIAREVFAHSFKCDQRSNPPFAYGPLPRWRQPPALGQVAGRLLRVVGAYVTLYDDAMWSPGRRYARWATISWRSATSLLPLGESSRRVRFLTGVGFAGTEHVRFALHRPRKVNARRFPASAHSENELNHCLVVAGLARIICSTLEDLVKLDVQGCGWTSSRISKIRLDPGQADGSIRHAARFAFHAKG